MRSTEVLAAALALVAAVDAGAALAGNPLALDATGFFHTQFADGRWWLVTPDGRPFYVNGIDHVTPTPDDDRTTGRCPYCDAIAARYPDLDAWATRDRRSAPLVGVQHARRMVRHRSAGRRHALHRAPRHGGRRRLVRAGVRGARPVDRRERGGAAARRSESRRMVSRQRAALGARLALAAIAARRLPGAAVRLAGAEGRGSLCRQSRRLSARARPALLPRHRPRSPRPGSESSHPRHQDDHAAHPARGAARGAQLRRRAQRRRLHAAPRPRRPHPGDVGPVRPAHAVAR